MPNLSNILENEVAAKTVSLKESPREQLCQIMANRLPVEDLPKYLKKLFIERADGGIRYIGLMNCKNLLGKGEFDVYISYSKATEE